jgi:hypothetical protein
MEEEKHLARDETNENMEKEKIIDNGNIISWYKCHFNPSFQIFQKPWIHQCEISIIIFHLYA